jgi:hypothetical protein
MQTGYLSGIRCFGTDDPSGEDEPYLIVTSVTPGDAFLGRNPKTVVKVWKSQTFEDPGVEAGQVFAENQLVFQDLFIGPYGVMLKVLLMEHEHGDEEKLRKEIADKGDKLAREVIDAAAVLAQIPIDQAIEDQVLNNEVLRTLGDLSVDLITNLLKDDKLGEKDWIVNGSMLKDWVDQGLTESAFVNYRFAPPETNFPREDGPDKLFSGGGSSYKVYLRIIPKKVIIIWDGTQPIPA